MTTREVAESLERFERELAAGRRRAAYEAALAAWRACRAPELAALVDRAAIVFAPHAPLVEKKQAAWLAVMRPATALGRIEFRASAVLAIDPKAGIATLEYGSHVSVDDPRSWVETPTTVARALASTAGLVMGPAAISAAPRRRRQS